MLLTRECLHDVAQSYLTPSTPCSNVRGSMNLSPSFGTLLRCRYLWSSVNIHFLACERKATVTSAPCHAEALCHNCSTSQNVETSKFGCYCSGRSSIWPLSLQAKLDATTKRKWWIHRRVGVKCARNHEDASRSKPHCYHTTDLQVEQFSSYSVSSHANWQLPWSIQADAEFSFSWWQHWSKTVMAIVKCTFFHSNIPQEILVSLSLDIPEIIRLKAGAAEQQLAPFWKRNHTLGGVCISSVSITPSSLVLAACEVWSSEVSARLNIFLKMAACNTASKMETELAPCFKHAGKWPLPLRAPGYGGLKAWWE